MPPARLPHSWELAGSNGESAPGATDRRAA